MNQKISRLRAEREKNNGKIAALQTRNREIDSQIIELENTDIIGMVDSLPAIEGTATGLDPANPMTLRPDVVVVSETTREEILSNAPQVEAGCVVVPRIVE